MLEEEEIAYPANQSEITCRRDLATCLSVQANVTVPGVDEDNQDYYLSVNSETYDIISWSAGEIVARLAGQCRIVLLTLNMHSDEVFEITRNDETEACREAYLTQPSLDKPRIARLGPSGQLTMDFWRGRREITGKFSNSRFRAEIEASVSPNASSSSP